MHPCDQIVIGRRVVHDQVQLADTWVPRACTASLGAQPVAVAIKWITELYADATRSTPIGGFVSPTLCSLMNPRSRPKECQKNSRLLRQCAEFPKVHQ